MAASNEVVIEEKPVAVENNITSTDFMYDAKLNESVAADLDYLGNDNNLNEVEESFKKRSSKDKKMLAISDDKLVISATIPATIEIVEEISLADDEGYFSDDASASSNTIVIGNSTIELPINSRTLAEDADLIDILYTAM